MSNTDAAISTHRFDTPLGCDDQFCDTEVVEGELDLLKLKDEATHSAEVRASVVCKRLNPNTKLSGEPLIRLQAERILGVLVMSHYRRGPIGFIEEFKEDFIAQISDAIRANRPIELVLSFFGSKVVNPLKTFSTTGCEVDLSETASLLRFFEISQAIRNVYAPGCVVNIACDGRKYSKPLGFPDEQGVRYFQHLCELAKYLGIDQSVKLFDEATLYPDNYEALRIEHVEKVSRALAVEPDGELAQSVAKMRPSLALAIPIDPSIRMGTLGLAYSGLEDADISHRDCEALDLRKDVKDRALQAAIAYVGTYDAVKGLGVIENLVVNLGALRATVHPKPKQIGLYTVNQSTAERFPHHGAGFFKGYKPADALDSVRIGFRADLARQGNLVGIRLSAKDHPFVDQNSNAPFTLVDRKLI